MGSMSKHVAINLFIFLQEESDLDMHLLQWHIQIFQPMMIFRQIISRASVDESFLRQPVNDDSRSYTLVLQVV